MVDSSYNFTCILCAGNILLDFFFGQRYLAIHGIKHSWLPYSLLTQLFHILMEMCLLASLSDLHIQLAEREENLQGMGGGIQLFVYNWSHCSLRQSDGFCYSLAWNRISSKSILKLKYDCIMLYLNRQKSFFFFFLTFCLFLSFSYATSATSFCFPLRVGCVLILFLILRPSPGSRAGKDSVGKE